MPQYWQFCNQYATKTGNGTIFRGSPKKWRNPGRFLRWLFYELNISGVPSPTDGEIRQLSHEFVAGAVIEMFAPPDCGVTVGTPFFQSTFNGLDGKSIRAVKSHLRLAFNVGYFTYPTVNGKRRRLSQILVDGDHLQFVGFGIKGSGRHSYEDQLAEALLKNDPALHQIADDITRCDLTRDAAIHYARKAVAEYFRETFGTIDGDVKGVLLVVADQLARQGQQLNQLTHAVDRLLGRLEERLPELDKEWYTTKEASELTPFKEFTLRQACNRSRLPEAFFKKNERTNKWWISKDGIVWLRENDLLSHH